MMQRLFHDSKGSMMMEYIVITFFIALPIWIFWNGGSISFGSYSIGFAGIYDYSKGELIGDGLKIQAFMQSIVEGISRPNPYF
ncbi:MAG: hypothetical protein GX561_12710 [Lentisphaerae bacterium]|jgi:hypothetical protein|nr:hypothetical protein [Lentisphaerota bacterium]